MRALERDTKSLCVVHKLCADDGFRGVARLHPSNHGHEHVLGGIIAVYLAAALADSMRAVAAPAMPGAADGEEAVKGVELSGRQAHGGADMVVVSGRVFRGDDEVCPAVPVQQFCAVLLHASEVALPRLDVEGVEAGGVVVVGGIYLGRVPAGFVVECVPEPVGCVREGGAA